MTNKEKTPAPNTALPRFSSLESLDRLGNLYEFLSQLWSSKAGLDRAVFETPEGLVYRYSDLHQGSARIANWLASLHLPKGSRVAAQVEKSPEAVMLYLATVRAGLVFLPLNTAYRSSEISYFIEDAEPGVVVCSPENLEWVAPLAADAGCQHVETLGVHRDGSLLQKAAPHGNDFKTVATSPDSLAAILYTSGTTGRSKGAMLSHRNLASNALVLHRAWQWCSTDVLLHALPIFHVHGLFVALHGALLNASNMLWLAKFDADQVFRAMPKASVMMGVPTFYVRMLEDARLNRSSTAQMRLFVSGSAPMLAETHQAFTERTGHFILERYGMSETIMLTSNPYEGERRPGTVGHPLEGVGLRLTHAETRAVIAQPALGTASEIGGVEVRGPNVFSGYWRMPEKTKEEFTADGWFKTGDVGRWDERGYLALVGRSKDLIITGGYNVYPKEIEQLLDDLPGVDESAVFGVPHPDFGEAVTAVVVPKSGARLEEAVLLAAIKGTIAGFKVPKRIYVADQLPRNVMGKVQKNELRNRYSMGLV